MAEEVDLAQLGTHRATPCWVVRRVITPPERNRMAESGPDPWPRGRPLEPRLQRTLHLAYAVDGVVAVRVWQWGPNVAIGVRGSGASSPVDLVRRVEAAVACLREPGEAWDFGVLDEPA
jgi:hypothetical protein